MKDKGQEIYFNLLEDIETEKNLFGYILPVRYLLVNDFNDLVQYLNFINNKFELFHDSSTFILNGTMIKKGNRKIYYCPENPTSVQCGYIITEDQRSCILRELTLKNTPVWKALHGEYDE